MRWILGALIFFGLALAGSEGEWFPWANLAGLVLFGGFVLLASSGEPLEKDSI